MLIVVISVRDSFIRTVIRLYNLIVVLSFVGINWQDIVWNILILFFLLVWLLRVYNYVRFRLDTRQVVHMLVYPWRLFNDIGESGALLAGFFCEAVGETRRARAGLAMTTTQRVVSDQSLVEITGFECANCRQQPCLVDTRLLVAAELGVVIICAANE